MNNQEEKSTYYLDQHFDFESIMREFGSDTYFSESPTADEDLDSFRISLGREFDSIADAVISSDGIELPEPAPEEADEIPEPEEIHEPEKAPDPKEVPEPVEDDSETVDGILSDYHEEMIQGLRDGYGFDGTEFISESEYLSDDDAAPSEYAEASEEYGTASEVTDSEPEKSERRRPASFKEQVLGTVISAVALISMKIKQSKLSLGSYMLDEDEELGQEAAPEKAAKFYDHHLRGARLRCRVSLVLSVILMYLSFGLPLGVMLGDVAVRAAVCTVLLLSVMLCGLDIITEGIMSLVRRRPDANALIALSSLLCVIDGIIIAAGMKSVGLPFSVIPAVTISLSLLGSAMNCRHNRIVLNTVASVRKPFSVTAETSESGEGITLLKSRIRTAGFVRRTEEAAPDETVFSLLAPYFLIIVPILSIIIAAVGKSFSGIAHILSGLSVCSVPFAMLITYPLPALISALGLRKHGLAIAGWSGIYDLGRAKHIVVTDNDLFTKDNIKISKVRILTGAKPEKVISLASSVISASGSCLAPAFTELMRSGKGSMLRVDELECHDGCGLVAVVEGIEVCCGSASFMQLMGVRLPKKYIFKDCVYIAENKVLCGLFSIEYTPTGSVRSALGTLMGSDYDPVFALRDFNITPKMLADKFDMVTDGFDFPSYSERCEISSRELSEYSKPSAILSRDGLAPFVSLAEHAKDLYTRIRISVMLSVLSSVIGIVLMFVLSLNGFVGVIAPLVWFLAWLIPVFLLGLTIKT